MSVSEKWKECLQRPAAYTCKPSWSLVKTYSFDICNVELYLQANGPGTFQRVLMVFPKNMRGRLPAVVVPYYFPEGMLGFELETEEKLTQYTEVAMMSHLAERGFITISADAYHLTYLDLPLPRDDFRRWQLVGAALNQDYPGWCGMGKLHADTMLLLEALEADERVDRERIGIAGHSLGGKMAFYTGCLDPRVKAVLASDFGFPWEQSNWDDAWYFGSRLAEMKAIGMNHTQILDLADGKPFFLLAGQYDNEKSYEMMQKAASYRSCPENLHFLNHASGHRPPAWALKQGYDFLEQILKKG